MPDLLVTKKALRKVLGIANLQATGQIDVETNVTTVSDGSNRAIVRLDNKDDSTNDEYLQIVTKGNSTSAIEWIKTGTGSYRDIKIANNNNDLVYFRAGGNVDAITADWRFATTRFQWHDPTRDHQYVVVTNELTADRNITLPLLTADDTFAFNDFPATLAGKTLTTPQINGLDLADASKTANYTLTTTDTVIRADSSGTAGGITMTLPAASGKTGQVYAIKKIDTSPNAVIIDGNASETIDGATTVTLSRDNDLIIIECDGTNWETIKNSIPDNATLVSNRVKLSGLAIPSASVTAASLMSLTGVFNGMTQTAGGTPTTTADATEGLVSNYVSAGTANVNCGCTTAAITQKITTAAFNPVLSVRFKIDSTTASRVWIGFTEGTLAISDTPTASGDACALFGFSTADTVFSCRTNDTTGASTTTAMTGITKDANWHTITIAITTSDVRFVLDDGAGEKTKTITTAADRPGNTDPLLVHFTGQTSTTTAKTFSCKFAEYRADK